MKLFNGHFAQGSFGLQRINSENGKQIGATIRVWTVERDDGTLVGRYLTRREARAAMRYERYEHETTS